MSTSLSGSIDWEELLDFISEKKLTPVIGMEMYKFRSGDALLPIEEYLCQKLLKLYECSEKPITSLPHAVNYLVLEKRVKTMDVTRKLKSIVKEISFDLPLLEEFLGIPELNYFINTVVYNNLLESKIEERKKQKPSSINFSINETFSDSEDLEKIKVPFVFNVFGSLLHTCDPALSEDDMMEYTGYFREKMETAKNIVNVLKNKNLLFLGCNFPDWMVRFILRLLSNEPFTEWGNKRSIIVVNDPSEIRKEQFAFLKNYDVTTFDGNTEDFIRELTERWKKRSPQSVKSKMIFLSYTVKDKDSVENLKTAIERLGNVTCWYDKREISAGDDFKTEIAKNIKSADLFIPLISANSLLHKDGYVQLEWFTADNVNTFRKIDGNTGKYLMPVVIDDSNPYDTNVPKYFSELSIGKVPQGIPDIDFMNQIKKSLLLP